VRTGRDCSCLSALSVFGCIHVVVRESTGKAPPWLGGSSNVFADCLRDTAQRVSVARFAMQSNVMEVQEHILQLLNPETLKYG
jgi:hypothetical protein